MAPRNKGKAEQGPQIGRLAMRREGENWNAYYAMPDTMDGALLLGSMRMAIVERNKAHKRLFMDLMREVVGDMIQDQTGVRPTWDDEQPGPEHERAGHA